MRKEREENERRRAILLVRKAAYEMAVREDRRRKVQENRCFRVGLDCSAGCIGDYVNNHRPVMARVISVVMMETTIGHKTDRVNSRKNFWDKSSEGCCPLMSRVMWWPE